LYIALHAGVSTTGSAGTISPAALGLIAQAKPQSDFCGFSGDPGSEPFLYVGQPEHGLRCADGAHTDARAAHGDPDRYVHARWPDEHADSDAHAGAPDPLADAHCVSAWQGQARQVRLSADPTYSWRPPKTDRLRRLVMGGVRKRGLSAAQLVLLTSQRH